jgi:hypothetical protein
VHAAAAGVVAFAGSVAGALHVVVAHAGNLRTSYSFLATIAVRRGQSLAAGAVVGTTGGRGDGHDGSVLHLGLRSGDTYIDPMPLLVPVDLTSAVHLAPTAAGPRAASEPSERRGLLDGLGDVVGSAAHATRVVLDAAGHVAGVAIADGRDALAAAGSGLRRVVLSRFPVEAAALRGVAAWWSERGHCDAHAPEADGTGGSDHRVMIVAGIDSSMTRGGPSVGLPAGKLGYEPGEVSYFSYAPGGGDYTPADTEVAIHTSALRLGAQLRALERRDPGREVDLLAHSQGGVVVEEFLAHVYQPTDPAYPPLGTVVALSSPLFGDPIATAIAEIESSLTGAAELRAATAAVEEAGVHLPSPESQATHDLASGSPLMKGIKHAPLPSEVQLTAIGGATDPIVPATASSRPGAQSTVVWPGLLGPHSAIVSDPAALRAARAAIEQKPLPCRSLASTVAAEVVATAIEHGEAFAGKLAAGVTP